MRKQKFYIVLTLLLLTFTFTTKAFASLTFSSSAITGDTSSTIDLGSSKDLYLQISGGKIGVGTTSPAYTLDVVGDANITGTYRVNGVPLSSGIGGSGTASYIPLLATGTTLGNSAIYQSAGNIGIGTTSPVSKLTIQGDATNGGLIIYDTGSTPNTLVQGYPTLFNIHQVNYDTSNLMAYSDETYGSVVNYIGALNDQADLTYDFADLSGTILGRLALGPGALLLEDSSKNGGILWADGSKLNLGTVNFTSKVIVDILTGDVGIGTTVPTSKLQVVGLPVYANNTAALAGGLTAGALYRTGADPDPVMIVH